jgi:outer membrane protein OmpA-like peptidoglycan-associated protein
MKAIYLPILFCIISFFNLRGQTDPLELSSFITTGTAFQTGEECFQLTSANLWQGGTIWYRTPIDLNNPFEMELNLFFGCDDEGADGMVFIFHPELRNGFQGEGIGFGGLRPALGIEMDTYHNPHLNDPYYDHVALMKDGRMHHATSLSNAQPLLLNNKNIEDCKNHKVRITWEPQKNNISIYVDGLIRLDEKIDIVNRVFDGNPKVYWGISAATGGKVNTHKICLKKLEFTTADAFSASVRADILRGLDYTLQNVSFLSGKAKFEDYSKEELDRLVALLKSSPKHHVYVSGHTDDVGSANQNKRISQQRADAVKNYLIRHGISAERIRTMGYGETEPKVDNDSETNRQKNRRIDIKFFVPRV